MSRNPEQEQLGQSPEGKAMNQSADAANDLLEVRRELGLVADRSHRERFINDESHRGLKSIENGLSPASLDLKGLLDFQREDYRKAQGLVRRMQGLIEEAIRGGAAGEKDRKFLMSRLILTGEVNLTEKAEEIEKKLKEKLDRLKQDRAAFDRVRHHPLAREWMISEDRFLDKSVPERRAFLKEAEKKLGLAQSSAEKNAGVESAEHMKVYGSLLEDAQKRRIIGKKTADKFMSAFASLKPAEQGRWIQEFSNQMERYDTLWKDIRSTLKGASLERMEALRDSQGYSELMGTFETACESDYAGGLRQAREAGIISLHTFKAFQEDFAKQPFPEKKRYLREADHELERYRTLRANIDAVPKAGVRAKLTALYDSPRHGYTEIHAAWQRATGQEHDPFAVVADAGKREAMEQAVDELGRRGSQDRRTFLGRVIHMFDRKTASQVDADNVAARRKAAQEGQTVLGASTESDAAKPSAPTDLQEQTRVLRDRKKHDRGFDQRQVKDAEGTHRETRVAVNRSKGLEHFLQEDHQRQFRREEDRGQFDRLTLTIARTSEQEVTLNRREIGALIARLKQEEEQEQHERQAA